jgi:peptidoglycan/xylan/chitin deacetylase (PgdA/CDA1 family)
MISRWEKFADRLRRRIRRSPAVAPEELDPAAVALRAHANQCRSEGIDGRYFILSFDCDTPEDAAAALKLDPVLRTLGVKTIYAVPGVTLRQCAASYQLLAESGACFINHGGRPHAIWDGDRYRGITFYNEMTPEEIVTDIEEGHLAVTDVIGRPPTGFRAPHFGYIQTSDLRSLIYRTLHRLGYRFSSGTLPALALERGPIVDESHGIAEVPLTGSRRAPQAILDSWNYYYEELKLKEEYYQGMSETIDFFADESLPVLLNFYVDPSHVEGASPFARAIERLCERNYRSVDFADLLRMTGR